MQVQSLGAQTLFLGGPTEKPGNSIHIYDLLYISNYSHIQNGGIAKVFCSQRTAELAETSGCMKTHEKQWLPSLLSDK